MLEDVRSHATSGATGDGMAHDEPLQRVGVVRLAIDDVEEILLQSEP